MTEIKEMITYDDFAKLDLRIATIVGAEEHPNADKLIVLKIDLGSEQRQIIAGIKGHYELEQLVGKQIIVVANLAPRKMRGLESNGMLLAASYGEGEDLKIVVVTPSADVPAGASVG